MQGRKKYLTFPPSLIEDWLCLIRWGLSQALKEGSVSGQLKHKQTTTNTHTNLNTLIKIPSLYCWFSYIFNNYDVYIAMPRSIIKGEWDRVSILLVHYLVEEIIMCTQMPRIQGRL